MRSRTAYIALLLLGLLISLPGIAYSQQLSQVQDPELRLQLRHALGALQNQLAEMPSLDREMAPAKFDDDSTHLGGIAGVINGISDADSAWVLAVAAHLFEDPTAWALGEVMPGGKFMITGLKRGTYIVMAGAPGYLAQYFSHGYTVWEAHPVEVNPPEIMHGIDFFLEPSLEGSGSISGHVMDAEDGSPISGAIVYAYMENNPFFGVRTLSNDDGSYTLPDLRSGTYRVFAAAEGYFEQVYNDSTGADGILVTVVDGEDTSGIDFNLHKGGTISGQIVDGEGQPIAGANIEAYPQHDFEPYPDERNFYGWATTDENGNYTISGLGDASYIVSAHVYGEWFNITRWYDNADRFEDATPVPVAFGDDVSGIDFVFDVTTEVGSLAGRIIMEDGTPATQAWVRLESVDRPNFYFYGNAHPDSDGNYVLRNVPVGAYRVVLEYWTQWFYNVMWYDGATNPEEATPVEILADQRTEGIDFEIPGADGVLQGTVTDKSGKPIANAFIQISSDGFGRPYEDIDLGRPIDLWAYANTDRDGAFSIEHIPDGEYVIAVFYCYIQECVQQWWPQADTPDRAEPVIVKDGQSEPGSIDFILPISLGNASISGVVNHTDGHPLAGAQVSLMPFENITPGVPDYGGNQLYTTTDSTGQYAFDFLPAGTFLVHASYWEDGGYAEQWYEGAPSAIEATPIPLGADETRSDIDFKLDVIPLYGSVAGQVFFEDGEAIRRAYVEAVPFYRDYADAIWWPYEHHAVTDDNGEFLMENLYEGEYLINVYAQGAEGVVDDSLGLNSLHVKIAGGEITRIEAPMRRQAEGPGEIAGIVTGEQGEPLEIAVIQAQPVIDFGPAYYTAIADENGNYRLTDLPEGQYYIQVRAPWHLTEYYDDAFDPSEAMLIDVTSDRPVEGIDIALSPLYILATDDALEGGRAGDAGQGSLIFGTVSDDNGDPIVDATVYVLDESGQALLSGQTHADGMYEISGVPPGPSYRLKATRVGYQSRYNEDAHNTDAAPPLTMNGSRLQVNFTLQKSTTATGTDEDSPLPAGLTVLGNYPNPFHTQTTIRLSMPETQPIEVTIYDALGREIQQLYNGVLPAGSHDLTWSPSDVNLSSGLYFYRILAGRQTLSGKMIYME